MKIFKSVLFLSSIALFVFACSQNTANSNINANSNVAVVNSIVNSNPANTAQSVDELAGAKMIYSQKCIKCHKEDGSGGVTDIEGTKIKAPDFHSDRLMNDKDADWIETINNGAKEDGMPAFKGKISDAEITNLVKYIHRDLQGEK